MYPSYQGYFFPTNIPAGRTFLRVEQRTRVSHQPSGLELLILVLLRSPSSFTFPLVPSRLLVSFCPSFLPSSSSSAGPVGRNCSAHPPPESGSREQPVLSGSIRCPTYLPAVSDRGGRGRRRGRRQWEVAQRRRRTTEEAGRKKSVFSSRPAPRSVSLAPPVSPSSAPPTSHSVRLSPKPLIPPPSSRYPNSRSLIPNLSFPLH